MAENVFDYRDYKKYLNSRLRSSGPNRGKRSQLADKIRCRSAFISQVLKAQSHFSLEHAIVINEFLGHTEDESHFFMLLLQRARAGSRALENYYDRQIDKVLEKREVVQSRIRTTRKLSREEEMIYYSSWYYAAIHVLISIPRFQDKAEIAKHLNLPLQQVSECLDFLVSTGIAVTENGKYRHGEARIHLGKDSPLISKHHMNWRMRSMEDADRRRQESLHYSLVFSLSESDRKKIEDILLDALDKTEKVMVPSKEEAAFCVSIDFFRI